LPADRLDSWYAALTVSHSITPPIAMTAMKISMNASS
jgi:hypothetical protein